VAAALGRCCVCLCVVSLNIGVSVGVHVGMHVGVSVGTRVSLSVPDESMSERACGERESVRLESGPTLRAFHIVYVHEGLTRPNRFLSGIFRPS
jgi:hypothetical protein